MNRILKILNNVMSYLILFVCFMVLVLSIMYYIHQKEQWNLLKNQPLDTSSYGFEDPEPEVLSDTKSVKQIIIDAAYGYGVSADFMLRLADCESEMNPLAVGYNGSWSIDRGLFQINSHYHSYVSDECCYDAKCSANWTAYQLSLGNAWLWSCYTKGKVKY